jgi:hypothetical protein
MNKIPGLVCAVACVACLSLGLLAVGQWTALAGGALVLAVWMFAHKSASIALSTTALVISVVGGAGGLLAGANPILMLVGGTLALASWDLVNLEHDLLGCLPGNATRRLEQRHLASLALALGIGLLVASAGRALRFQPRFGVVFILVVGVLFCLDRFWRAFEK